MTENINISRGTYGSLLRLGLPVLVTQIGSVVVGMADTMMVGAYGTMPLAAAAFVNNLFMIPLVMIMGFAGGVTPLVGALYGAKDYHGVGRMMRAGIRVNLAVSLIFTAAMLLLYFALPYMGQDPALLPLIREYYLIVLGSMVVGALFFPAMQAAMGVTDTLSPMIIILGANVMNVLGNYALIYGHWGMPEWGLNGAGISTLAGRVAAALAMLGVIRFTPRYRKFRSGLRERGTPRAMRREMVSTSVPVMIQSGVECAMWAVGAVVCGWFGAVQLAAYQVILSLGQLGFMTYMSFASAVAIRVANLTGMGLLEQLRRTARAGLTLNLGLATAANLFFLLGGRLALELFTDDAAVKTVALTLILPLALYQYADAAQMTYVNALRGTSRVKPLITISVMSYIVVGMSVLFGLACGLDMGAKGVYYSFSVALLLAGLLYLRSFLRVTAR